MSLQILHSAGHWASPFGPGCSGVRFAPVLRTKPGAFLTQEAIELSLLILFFSGNQR